LEDALSVVAAALDRRAAYIDVCADGGVGEAIGDAYSDAARRAGVPLFLGVAPIGGALGEWLGVEAARAVCATDDPSEIDEIVLAYASDGLPRSTGSLRSGLKMLLEPTLGTGSHARLDFPPPFGRAFAFRFPLGSGCLCQLFPRAAVDVYASLCLDGVDSALSTALILGAMAWTTRLRNPGPVFEALASRLSSFEGAPEDSTVDGLTFAVVAQAASGRRHTSVAAVGSAPYRLTAAMIELVLQQLASGRAAGGVVGVSELVPASAALDALARTCDLRLFESGDEPVRGRRE
jgi:hypothetical protein